MPVGCRPVARVVVGCDGRSAGDEMAGDRGAAGGGEAGLLCDEWWVHAQGLFDHRREVGEFGGGGKGYVGGIGEGAPDFVCKAVQSVRVAEEIVERSGEDRGGGLGTGEYQADGAD